MHAYDPGSQATHTKADGSSDGSLMRVCREAVWVILGFSVVSYLGLNVVVVTLCVFLEVGGCQQAPEGEQKEWHFE